MIRNAAGVMPVPHDDPPATELLGADGSALHVTLGAWELTGLLPSARYRVFVVHLKVNGTKRASHRSGTQPEPTTASRPRTPVPRPPPTG